MELLVVWGVANAAELIFKPILEEISKLATAMCCKVNNHPDYPLPSRNCNWRSVGLECVCASL